MNFEKINNVTTAIEAENSLEQEDKLNEKIEQISLIYANKKWQDGKSENPDYKFSEALQKYSSTKDIILKPFFNLDNPDIKEYQKLIDSFLEEFYQEVDLITQASDFDISQISDLVNLERDSIINYLGAGDLKKYELDTTKQITKIIAFNKVDHIENTYNLPSKKYQDLKTVGFSNNDNFLEVHFEAFYKTDGSNLGPELIINDFKALAEYIVKESPETAAIIGQSWLLDTPIANRLGFKKIDGDKVSENDFSTWLQFIGSDGQINKKRFNKFLETEELPFKSVQAYIPVLEFLEKYLPDDLRGEVVLKEIDQEKIKEHQTMELAIGELASNWNNLLKDSYGFEKIVSNNSLNKIFEFVSLEEKQIYLNFFKDMLDQKIEFKDIGRYKNIEVEMADNNLRQKMKADLYKDKKIII